MSEPDSDLKAAAEEIGLTRLEGRQWEELKKALDAKDRLTAGMPAELSLTDEPAHIFRAGEEA